MSQSHQRIVRREQLSLVRSKVTCVKNSPAQQQAHIPTRQAQQPVAAAPPPPPPFC